MTEPAQETAQSTALVPLPEPVQALVAFSTDKGLDSFIEKVAAAARAKVAEFDISTPKGRAGIASVAYDVAKEKNDLDRLKKSLTSDVKKKLGAIDAEGGRAWDELEKLQKEIRAPLTAWEQKDEQRRAGHEQNIARIESLSKWEPGKQPTEAEIIARVDDMKPFATHVWEEFQVRAEKAMSDALRSLTLQLDARREQDRKDAELKRLQDEENERKRKAEEKRIADEATAKAEEKARQDAEAERQRVEAERAYDAAYSDAQLENADFDRLAAERKAEADKQALQRAKDAQEAAAKKAEAEAAQKLKDEQAARLKAEDDAIKAAAALKASQEQAERDRIAADAKAKREALEAAERATQAERDKQAAETKRIDDERLAREANLEHKRKINREAVEKIADVLEKAGPSSASDEAIAIITAIAQGKIPHVSIKY